MKKQIEEKWNNNRKKNEETNNRKIGIKIAEKMKKNYFFFKF